MGHQLFGDPFNGFVEWNIQRFAKIVTHATNRFLAFDALGSEFVENIRRNGYPDQDQNPDSAFKDVVVVKEPGPRMFHNVMAEQEFKGHGQGQPDEAYGNGLVR